MVRWPNSCSSGPGRGSRENLQLKGRGSKPSKEQAQGTVQEKPTWWEVRARGCLKDSPGSWSLAAVAAELAGGCDCSIWSWVHSLGYCCRETAMEKAPGGKRCGEVVALKAAAA